MSLALGDDVAISENKVSEAKSLKRNGLNIQDLYLSMMKIVTESCWRLSLHAVNPC